MTGAPHAPPLTGPASRLGGCFCPDRPLKKRSVPHEPSSATTGSLDATGPEPAPPAE